MAPIYCCLGRRAAARATLRQLSASHSSKTAGACCSPAPDLVQRLQIARRELALEAAIAKLDKFHLLILDDLAYVTKEQAETSVLFELISARYERRPHSRTADA